MRSGFARKMCSVGQRPRRDAPVENEQRALERLARVEDDPLAARERADGLARDRRLVGDQGRDGRLDEARREGEGEERDDERRDRVAAGNDGRDGGDDEDDVGDDADEGADPESLREGSNRASNERRIVCITGAK